MIFEVCVDSISSVQAAVAGGSNRIELCSALSVGGLSPSAAFIKKACQSLSIPVNVLIRPRPGDFLYTTNEFEIICQDVLFCKQSGANAVVVGFLNADGSVDKIKTSHIVQLSSPMEVTFHRAFDMVNNWEIALETLIECGVKRVLTSGLANTAWEGRGNIIKIIEKANNRIEILVGSGINKENAKEIAIITKCNELHFSAKMKVESQMIFRNHAVLMGKTNETEFFNQETSATEVNEIIRQFI